jgi:hypothetical protein
VLLLFDSHLLHDGMPRDLVGVEKLLVLFQFVLFVKALHLTHDVKDCFENEFLVRHDDGEDCVVVGVHRDEDL